MIRILFICHGNICRSPMAEFVMKDMVRKEGMEDLFEIASAATSREALGCSVYPPARDMLISNGISCKGKTARQMTRKDYDDYDLLVCMDHLNIRNILRIIGDDPQDKVHMLLEYADRPGEEVDDPWYSGDFVQAWKDIVQGCTGLLSRFKAGELP